MKAARTFKTLLDFYQTRRFYNPEDGQTSNSNKPLHTSAVARSKLANLVKAFNMITVYVSRKYNLLRTIARLIFCIIMCENEFQSKRVEIISDTSYFRL